METRKFMLYQAKYCWDKVKIMKNEEQTRKSPEKLAEIIYRAIKRYIKYKNAQKREEFRQLRLDSESEQSVNYAHYKVD